MPTHGRDWPVEQIRQWIEVDLWTHEQVAQALGCVHQTISKVCRKNGIRTQRTGPRSGAGHPEWQGGRIVDKDGYVLLWTPDHPNRRKHTRHMLEHRLVMEQHLGRLLDPSEVVHHKNGNKQDNRIENLELFSSNGEHLRQTLAGQCPQWSDDGKARILQALRRPGKSRRRKAPDGSQSHQATDRSTS